MNSEFFNDMEQTQPKCCIAILTDAFKPDRPGYLERTVDALIANTWLPSNQVAVQIFCDGFNNKIIQAIKSCVDKMVAKDINVLDTVFSNGRMGCGAMVNIVWEQTRHFKYTLFLEGDWLLMNDTPDTWLFDMLEFMDKNQEVDTIWLRKYLSQMEMRQYCVFNILLNPNNYLGQCSINGMPARVCTNQIYSNNPHLRRNHSYEDVLPLDVDAENPDTPDSANWSNPEISAEARLHSKLVIYPNNGLFAHAEFVDRDCNGNAQVVSCKYSMKQCKLGYCSLNHDWCPYCMGDDNKSAYRSEEEFLEYIKIKEANERERDNDTQSE